MVTTAGAKLVWTSVTVAAAGPVEGESDDPDADWTGTFCVDEHAAVAIRASGAASKLSR